MDTEKPDPRSAFILLYWEWMQAHSWRSTWMGQRGVKWSSYVLAMGARALCQWPGTRFAFPLTMSKTWIYVEKASVRYHSEKHTCIMSEGLFWVWCNYTIRVKSKIFTWNFLHQNYEPSDNFQQISVETRMSWIGLWKKRTKLTNAK